MEARAAAFEPVRYNLPALRVAAKLRRDAAEALLKITAKKDDKDAAANRHRSMLPGDQHVLLATRLLKIQDGRCYLSGDLFCEHDPPTWEHVIPRSAGGKNGGNRLLATFSANNAKGSRLPFPCEMIYLDAANLILKVARKRQPIKLRPSQPKQGSGQARKHAAFMLQVEAAKAARLAK